MSAPTAGDWEWSPLASGLPGAARSFDLPPTFIASRNLPPGPRPAASGLGPSGAGRAGAPGAPVRFQAVFRVRVCAVLPGAREEVCGPWSALTAPVWLSLQPGAEA